MRISIDLWQARFSAPFDAAETLAELLGAGAVAQSIDCPPRQRLAMVELLFKGEPDAAALAGQLAILAETMGIAPPPLTVARVPPLDWLRKVHEEFPPLPIARWTVHGRAYRGQLPAMHDRQRRALQIDATSAFGTGEHPTTRGCMLMLDRLLKGPTGQHRRHMLDLGCGSGILALAYARATKNTAVAVDLDPDSVAVAQHNIRTNGAQRQIRCAVSYGYRNRLIKRQKPYDLIMANIFAGPLCRLAKDLRRHLAPGGYVILSGILNHQANRVLVAHRMQGLYLRQRLVIGEWSVLALQRPQRAD